VSRRPHNNLSLHCQRKGCADPPLVLVKLLVYGNPPIHTDPEPVYMNVALCLAHQREVQLDQLIHDDNWPNIVEHYAHKHRLTPDRNLLQLRFIRLDSPEVTFLIQSFPDIAAYLMPSGGSSAVN